MEIQRRPEGEKEEGRVEKEARQFGTQEWLKSEEERKRACEMATCCTSSNDAGLAGRMDGPEGCLRCCALGWEGRGLRWAGEKPGEDEDAPVLEGEILVAGEGEGEREFESSSDVGRC